MSVESRATQESKLQNGLLKRVVSITIRCLSNGKAEKFDRQLAEAVEHLAQAYAIVKYGQAAELPETIVSGRSEFFQCSIKQSVSFIANAFKMAKKLNNDVLKIAQYAKQYIEKKLNYLPINMARWLSQI